MKLEIDKPYINIEYELYITVDYALKAIVACDYVMGEFYQTTCGRLKEISSDLAKELENHFKIDLAEYGVEIFNAIGFVMEIDKKKEQEQDGERSAVEIELNREAEKLLIKYAYDNDLTISEIVELALREYVKKHQYLLEKSNAQNN